MHNDSLQIWFVIGVVSTVSAAYIACIARETSRTETILTYSEGSLTCEKERGGWLNIPLFILPFAQDAQQYPLAEQVYPWGQPWWWRRRLLEWRGIRWSHSSTQSTASSELTFTTVIGSGTHEWTTILSGTTGGKSTQTTTRIWREESAILRWNILISSLAYSCPVVVQHNPLLQVCPLLHPAFVVHDTWEVWPEGQYPEEKEGWRKKEITITESSSSSIARISATASSYASEKGKTSSP